MFCVPLTLQETKTNTGICPDHFPIGTVRSSQAACYMSMYDASSLKGQCQEIFYLYFWSNDIKQNLHKKDIADTV